MPNVVVLPHIGSATEETRDAMARIAASEVARFLRHEPQQHRVA
jgi:glyoxylate reductase